MSIGVCFCDLDGVLFDFVSGVCNYYEVNKEEIYPFGRQITYRIDSIFEELGIVKATDFWKPFEEDFWANLPLEKEAKEIVEILEQRFKNNIYICSSPTSNLGCVPGKLRSIRKYFPQFERKFIFTKHKYLLAGPGRYLLDDHDANVEAFCEAGGEAILIGRPWNKCHGDEKSNIEDLKTLFCSYGV